MRGLKSRLLRLENRLPSKSWPTIVVVNPGECIEGALKRLGLSAEFLIAERREGRVVLFVRWAG